MLDETTYYFTAFAIDQNNNIIDSQTLDITTDFGWNVTPNTLAYFPLDSINTTNDLSGHGNVMTNQGATFGTYAGVDCANVNGKSIYGAIANLPTGNSARTIIVWAYLPNSTSAYRALYGYGQNSTHKRITLYNAGDRCIVLSHYTDDIATNTLFPIGQWCMITYTYDGTTAKLYLNDTLIGQINVSINTASSNLVISGWQQGNETFPGYLSRFILEDRTRSLEDIQSLFNKFKSSYGL